MSSFFDKAKHAATDLFHKVSTEFPKVTHTKKILIALTSAAPAMPDHRTGFHWSEVVQPYEVFIEKGWDVDLVSETGSATPDEQSIDKQALAGDKKRWENKEYTLHRKLSQIRSASQINPNEYAAIFFAGGHACVVDFPTAVNLKKLAAQIYESGGVVGAVCHGPAIFQNLNLSNGQSLLKGKEVTGFSSKGEDKVGATDWLKKNNYLTMEQIAVTSGGVWKENSDPMADYTRCSDRVVTGMNPSSAASVAKTMLDFLPKEEQTTQAAGTTTATTSNSSSSKLPANLAAGFASVKNTLGMGDKHAQSSTHTQTEAEKARTYQGENAGRI